MAIDDLIQDAERRMHKSVEAAQAEFSTLRTGRASPALLDRVQIDYYGQQTPLKQLATISAPEPRMLTIQPFDPNAKFLPHLTHLEAIERGLKVMDTTALSLCMDNKLTIHVFELADGNIGRVVAGDEIGTVIETP